MNTVLVTGAYGFLGRYTSLLFKERGWRVIGMGHGHWGFENPLDFGIDRWIEADTDFYALTKIGEELNCVIHCAGGASVGYSVQYPLRDFNRTVSSSVNILEYIRIYQPQAKLIYPSSAAVYGAKENNPLSEKENLNPVSPYGFHKKIVEELCASYASNFGLSVAIIRFFSLYGAGLKKQLLWDACNKLIRSNELVEFFGTGAETRDWLHVSDAAELIIKIAKYSEKYIIINGGYGEKTSIKQIISALSTRLDSHHLFRFNNESRAGDPKHYWADVTIAKQLGWTPKVAIETGLKEYVDWFRAQR